MKGLKRAVFDIETSLGLFYSFANNMYEAQLSREHTPIKLLMVSFKEPNKRPYNLSLIDFKTYPEFLSAVRERMCSYDLLVGQNGKKFDLRQMNTFFAEVGLSKIDKFPRNLIDTRNEARREFNLPSYSLKYLAHHFGLPAKLDPGGENRWYRCMAFNADGTPTYPQDWKEMKRYCNGDVITTEALFDFLENGGWVKWPAHIQNIYVPGEGCIQCGGEDMQSRGKDVPRANGLVEAYMCKNCGKRNYTSPTKQYAKISTP